MKNEFNNLNNQTEAKIKNLQGEVQERVELLEDLKRKNMCVAKAITEALLKGTKSLEK